MERFGMSSSLRDNKVKEPWRYYHCYQGGGGGGDSTTSSSCLLGGFPWPPRSYICSFCKREFKSAQALGGHMNVHRRDRARLRESPPWIAPTSESTETNPNPNSSPVPNPTHVSNPNADTGSLSPAMASKVPKVTYTFPSVLSPITQFASPATSSAGPFSLEVHNPRTRKGMKSLSVVGEMRSFVEEDKSKKLRREREVVRLDLEIGMSGDLEEEDLDLELRLGHA